MFGRKPQKLMGEATGFLARLRRDARGNTLAMMAAMLVPLAGLTGSAIDMGRLYAVKSRLQQACDSGVLAARKSMIMASASSLSTDAKTNGQNFFKSNFQNGWYNTTNVSFTPSMVPNSQVEVQGTASADVPMTIMSMVFDMPAKTVSVSCTARYDVSDSDVMFVLDTTGSMSETLSGSSGSKIVGLRSAVLSFYDTMAAALAQNPDMHVRYGFVPYTVAANVGRLLDSSWLVPAWKYNTRVIVDDLNYGGPTAGTGPSNQAQCLALQGRTPALPSSGVRTVESYDSTGKAQYVTVAWTGSVCNTSTQTLIPKWRYGFLKQDVSAFITQSDIEDPTKVTRARTAWTGCVEERPTTAGATSFSPLPPDLDPDLVPKADLDADGVPTANDTRWRPHWPDVTYDRGARTEAWFDDSTPTSSSPYGDNSAYLYTGKWSSSDSYKCPQPASKLGVMTRDQVNTYVNTLTPGGTTYLDAGMIWGARLISPSGLFASTTAAWPGHPAPNRYVIFMTDGAMNTVPGTFTAKGFGDYSLYGVEKYDTRVGNNANISQSALQNLHMQRFLAVCAAVKNNLNITIFTIGFGPSADSNLTKCASPNKSFQAANNAELTAAFQQIAQAIAQLRISQ